MASPSPPSFDAFDFETDERYLAWRSRVETAGVEISELKLRQRFYKRTIDPSFAPPANADDGAASGVRQRRPAATASAAAAAAPPPRATRTPSRTTTTAPPTARAAARYAVLALLPLALALTPVLARLVAALPLPLPSSSASSASSARPPLAALVHAAGAWAYSACLAASFVAQLLAVRDRHGAPPLSGGVAALRQWAARALDNGVAREASLAAWALLFLVHRNAARVGLALVPLAVSAATDSGGSSAALGPLPALPPRRLVEWWTSARPLGPGLATAAQISAWGHVATALYLALARFPLALVAGPAGSARAAGLLGYYCFTLLRARKSASDAAAAAQKEAWRVAGAWARPRIERIGGGGGGGGGGGLGRAYAFVRDRWWDAPVFAERP